MLPSKKIITSLILLIAGTSALAWYGYKKTSMIEYVNSESNGSAAVLSSSTESLATQKDSDSDGLPDWEEGLYGTNPNKADTDSDGTNDGKEVDLGRNPLIKGPKDFLVTKEKTATSTTEKEDLTLTDTFARNFFTQYANLQQSGVKVTADNASQIAGDYLKATELPAIVAKQYSESDLYLTDSDQAKLRNYRDAITAVFAKYWPNGNPNELNILQQSFNNNDPKALTKLTLVIKSYQNVLDNSLSLAVPKLAASLHLNVVNTLSAYIQTLKMIEIAYSDPLAGLVGLNSYQNNQTNVLVSVANLRIYFINSIK